MSTSIGSVTLDNDMVWTDELIHNAMNAFAAPTIGGGVVVQEYQRLEKGRPITLSTAEGFGYQLKSTVEALLALAAIPNATYTLTVDPYTGSDVVKTVRFRNEVEGGAVQFSPVQAREGVAPATFWYQGTISLMIM